MRFTTQTVTPELAREWLEANTGNRVIRPRHVIRLADAMKRGMWKTTHQGIAFDVNGRLVDGQHRLMAISQSGVSVEMAVSFDVPADTFGALDQGERRDLSDILGIGAKQAAIVNGLYEFYFQPERMRLSRGPMRVRSLMPQIRREVYEAFEPEIEMAVKAVTRAAPKRALGKRDVFIAAILRLYQTEDAVRQERILTLLHDFTTGKLETLPKRALELVRQLTEPSLATSRVKGYGLMARAWQLFDLDSDKRIYVRDPAPAVADMREIIADALHQHKQIVAMGD